MIEHISTFRIQYNETDQMGVVHHANYLKYMEMGRIEWLRSLGVSYAEMERRGVLLPVVSVQVNFRHPCYFDDTMTLTTRMVELPRGSIRFDYCMVNQNGVLVMKSEAVLAFIDSGRFRPVKCPPDLFAIFEKAFKAPV